MSTLTLLYYPWSWLALLNAVECRLSSSLIFRIIVVACCARCCYEQYRCKRYHQTPKDNSLQFSIDTVLPSTLESDLTTHTAPVAIKHATKATKEEDFPQLPFPVQFNPIPHLLSNKQTILIRNIQWWSSVKRSNSLLCSLYRSLPLLPTIQEREAPCGSSI